MRKTCAMIGARSRPLDSEATSWVGSAGTIAAAQIDSSTYTCGSWQSVQDF